MMYSIFINNNKLDSPLEAMIQSIEAAWSCRITIHDLLGRSGQQPMTLLFNGRSMHTHRYCQWRRQSQSGWHKACNQHCLEQMTRRVLAGPGCHECWKGAREVVIPVIHQDQHLFTLFAGVFQGTAPLDLKKGSAWHQHWQALPQINDQDMLHLSAQLEMLGQVLIQHTQDRTKPQQARKGLINTFLREHAHLPVGLEDLADALGISPGQCSREVTRLMGKSFRKLLIEERLKRAAILITNYDLSLETIAERVGFSDQYHLNKSFKQHYGLPPGQWKRQHVDAASSPRQSKSKKLR